MLLMHPKTLRFPLWLVARPLEVEDAEDLWHEFTHLPTHAAMVSGFDQTKKQAIAKS